MDLLAQKYPLVEDVETIENNFCALAEIFSIDKLFYA
jgi:hypothetical protein